MTLFAICYLLFASDVNGKVAPRKLRLSFYHNLGIGGKQRSDTVHHSLTEFLMGHFAATEDDNDSDTIAVGEELLNLAEFDVKVVVADFEADFHSFELGLFFAGFFTIFGLFFHLLVLVFAPVDDFDNGRVGVGGDFHQVNSLFTGEQLRVAAGHNTQLLSISTNYTN